MGSRIRQDGTGERDTKTIQRGDAVDTEHQVLNRLRARGNWRAPTYAVFAVIAVLIAGCAVRDGADKNMVSDASLYAKVGRQESIARIVDRYVDRLLDDPGIHFSRQSNDVVWQRTPERVRRLKEHMTQFFCMATGGTEVYEGADLRTAHERLGIKQSEFDRALDLLGHTLLELSIPRAEARQLRDVIERTRSQIEERPPAVEESDPRQSPAP